MIWNKRSFILIDFQLRFAVRDYEVGRKSGGSGVAWEHQFVFFADDVNLLGENISVAKKSVENVNT
jgi:hypothetical protein